MTPSMSNKNIKRDTLLALLVVFFIGLGIAWRIESSRASLALEETRRREAELQARLRPRAPGARETKALAAVGAESGKPEQMPASAAPPRQLSPEAHGPRVGPFVAAAPVRANPEAHFAARRARIAVVFHRLYIDLKLSPEAVEEFERSLTESGRSFEQFESVLNASATSTVSPATQDALLKNMAREWSKNLLGLIGEEGVSKFNRILASLPVEDIVRELVVTTSLSSNSMSATQIDEVSEALRQNARRIESGNSFSKEINWAAVFGAIPGTLSPGQMETLRAIAAAREYQASFRRKTGQAAPSRLPHL